VVASQIKISHSEIFLRIVAGISGLPDSPLVASSSFSLKESLTSSILIMALFIQSQLPHDWCREANQIAMNKISSILLEGLS